ncbi:waprin-Thr1-like [Chelonus insularis]|uniref:waprin-Thr1-like n=1 Tax=Chelonus insularis TaxID=460826 RepID=UPI00158DEAB3|nr:waprin-Thr1-like [Chelonus insularis]
MEGKTIVYLLFVILVIGVIDVQGLSKGGLCPLKSTISKCMPTCMSDFQCSFNQVCCPNRCGSKSCAAPSPVNTGNGYKDSNGETYCGNRKCSRYEKCIFNSKTKREECVRT